MDKPMIVTRLSEITNATEYLKRHEGARTKGLGKATLICEELLLHLLKAGYSNIEVAIRGGNLPRLGLRPHVELRAEGAPDDLNSKPPHGDGQVESEINRNILEQYQDRVSFRYAGGVNCYRIFFEEHGAPDLREEIYTFYQQKRPQGETPLAVLWAVAKKHRARVSLSFTIQSVKHLAALMLPVFAANMIETVTARGTFFCLPILLNILAFAVSLAINLFCATWYNQVYHRFARAVETGFKMAMVQKLQTLSMKYHSDTPGGKVLTKLVSDVQFIKMLICDHLLLLIYLFWDIIFVIATTLLRCPVMLVFYAVAVPLVTILIRRAMIPITTQKVHLRRQTEGSNAAFKEMLSLTTLTRAQGLQKTEYRTLSSTLWGVQSAANRYDDAQLHINNIGYFASQSSRLLCLCFALFLAEKGAITLGSVILFHSIFEMIINSVQRVMDALPQITQGYDSLASVNEILLASDTEKNGMRHLPTPVRGEIEFRNVRFGYAADQESILDGLSFHVPPGKCAAFVGRSGGGKTTLLNLLLGFYSRQGGQILIDGVDIDELDKNSYRHHIGVVPQHTVLFSGTLWDNMTYGLKYVTTSQVLDALRSVGLDSLLSSLPDGLNSLIHEEGSNLSGGQRQRLAIARLLLRKPKIVLFDEITSALDIESERQVQEAVESIMGKCTMLMVAHRLNTLRRADLIYRIEGKKAVPCSSFEQIAGEMEQDAGAGQEYEA